MDLEINNMINLFLQVKKIFLKNRLPEVVDDKLYCSGNITYFNSSPANYILCDILYPPNNNFCSTFEDSFYQRKLYIISTSVAEAISLNEEDERVIDKLVARKLNNMSTRSLSRK